MIGEQDRRQSNVAGAQAAQQFKPVHMRHSIVQHDASGARQIGVRQQFSAATMGVHLKTFEIESELQRIAHARIVIGDQDKMLRIRHN
jgi:hypothetical protein